MSAKGAKGAGKLDFSAVIKLYRNDSNDSNDISVKESATTPAHR